MGKPPPGNLAAAIRKTGVNLNPKPADFAEVSRTLGEVEFETKSSTGEVAVWMKGNGRLVDVVVTNEAFEHLDERKMADLLTGTIRQAETDLRQAIGAAVKREQEASRGQS